MSYPIASIISRARNSSSDSASQIWAGFLLCDGSTYLKSDYPDLYAKFSDNSINTSTNGYGVDSSDSSKFLVPNLSDCSPCMVNSNNTSGQLGATSGNLETTLNKYLLPSHYHSYNLSSDHKHSFTYQGFTQGYQVQSSKVGDGIQQYNCINSSQLSLIKPTSLINTNQSSLTTTIGDYGSSSSTEITSEITNSYVGVDYYIKY